MLEGEEVLLFQQQEVSSPGFRTIWGRILSSAFGTWNRIKYFLTRFLKKGLNVRFNKKLLGTAFDVVKSRDIWIVVALQSSWAILHTLEYSMNRWHPCPLIAMRINHASSKGGVKDKWILKAQIEKCYEKLIASVRRYRHRDCGIFQIFTVFTVLSSFLVPPISRSCKIFFAYCSP